MSIRAQSISTIVVSALMASGCGHGTETQIDASLAADQTARVQATVSNQNLNFGNSVISFESDGTFQFFYDADIRYFRSEVSQSSRDHEVDAHCGLKLVGQYQFLKDDRQFGTNIGTDLGLILDVKNAAVISAKVLRSDLSSLDPVTVCAKVANEIRIRQSALPVMDYANHFLLLNTPYLHLTNFYADLHQEHSLYGYESPMVRNNYRFAYFVAAKKQVDVTRLALQDLDGSFALKNETLTFNSSLKLLSIADSGCKSPAVLQVNSVLALSDGIYMIFDPAVSSFDMKCSDDSLISYYRNIFTSLTKAPAQIAYATFDNHPSQFKFLGEGTQRWSEVFERVNNTK